jgi:hypothetical protein
MGSAFYISESDFFKNVGQLGKNGPIEIIHPFLLISWGKGGGRLYNIIRQGRGGGGAII